MNPPYSATSIDVLFRQITSDAPALDIDAGKPRGAWQSRAKPASLDARSSQRFGRIAHRALAAQGTVVGRARRGAWFNKAAEIYRDELVKPDEAVERFESALTSECVSGPDTTSTALPIE